MTAAERLKKRFKGGAPHTTKEEKKIKQYLSKEIYEQLVGKENLKILKNFNTVFDGYDIYQIIESFLF